MIHVAFIISTPHSVAVVCGASSHLYLHFVPFQSCTPDSLFS
jgi:hypothetical protein